MATRVAARNATRQTFLAIVGLGLTLVVLGVSLVVPRLEAPRLRASRDANLQIERARRILAQYDAGLSLDRNYRSLLGDEWFELSTETLNELLGNPDYDVAADVNAKLTEYANNPAIKELPGLEQKLLTLQYGQAGWPAHKSPAPPTRMNGAGMATRGSEQYSRRLEDNARILDQALGEANKALQIQYGDYSTRNHPAANRLAGAIHYQQGLELVDRVLLMRQDLATRRFGLKNDIAERQRVERKLDLVAASDIDSEISRAQAEHQSALADVVDHEAKVEVLNQHATELRGRVEAAVQRSEAAREAMEALQDIGADLSSPGGFGEFRTAYSDQALRYRQAVSEAHRLERGTLTNAIIDYTGDYVHGKYVPIQQDREIGIDRGLTHWQQDLDTAMAELEGLNDTAQRLAENVETLKGLKRSFEDRARIADEAAAGLRQRIESEFSAYLAAADAIRQVDEEALARFEQAAKSFRAALEGVAAEQRDASAVPAKPTDTAQQAYQQLVGRQQSLEGQVLAEQGDARLRMGLICLGRYQDANDALQDLGGVPAAAERREGWRESAEAARQATIEHTDQAIAILKDRAKTKLKDSGWLVAAEIGVAHYVQAMVGVEFADQKAQEWYRLAVDGREGVPAEHQVMWDYLKARIQAPEPPPATE